MKKTAIWIGVALSILASGYSVWGAIVTTWISATPGQHDLQALEFWAYLFLVSAVIFLGIAGALTYFVLRKRPGSGSFKPDP